MSMNELSTEELLLHISEKESDLEMAHACFSKLYHRFAEFLYIALIGHAKSKGINNKEFVDTALSNTFNEIFLKPLGFSYDPKKHNSEDTAFKAWISTIARNEFNDLLKNSLQSLVSVKTVDSEFIEEFAELSIDEEYLSENRKMLDKALEILKDREKHILLTCYDYYMEGKNTPSEVLDYLCEYWGTTRDNVRQIKKRSLDKVEKQLSSLINLKVVK